MIDKKLIQEAMYWHGQKEECLNKDDYKVYSIKQEDSDLVLNLDNIDDGFIVKWNIYELGVLFKEYLEYYAKSLSLNGVWIDLNDLSKDESYYFRHCAEVYDGLFQYDLIMESEEL